MIAIFGCLWITNLGGIPGGGLVVPLCMLFFQFDPKNAIALSVVSIFTSGLIRYFLIFRYPHPLKNGKGTIIDYNIPLIMYPFIIMGVQFGVILNIIMPTIFIFVFYILLFAFLVFSLS